MNAVEIIYRYEARDIPAKPRPLDGDAALVRLSDGNRDFASLLDLLKAKNSLAQRVVQVDPRDIGLLPGETDVPKQRPFAAILGCSDARVRSNSSLTKGRMISLSFECLAMASVQRCSAASNMPWTIWAPV
jgi:hypothetical protein